MKSKIIYKIYRLYCDGRIKKLSYMARRGGELLSPSISNTGYFRVTLILDGKHRKTFSVSRLVGEYFVNGKTNIKKYINHKDGNKRNNYYKNLEWCTMSHNTKHAYSFGLSKKIGKLTLNQVKEIYLSPKSYNILAKIFNVSSTAIKKIKRKISYNKFTKGLNIGKELNFL